MSQPRNSEEEPVELVGAAPRATQVAAISAFVLINLAVPLLIGELFPFSVSPMFCDKPEVYCEYKVFSLTENEYKMFDSRIHRGPSFITKDGHLDFGLQQLYNGNPVGLGVGVKPPLTINHFGEIASEAEVRRVVEANLRRMNKKGVRVQQLVYGAIDDQQAGQVQSNEWIISISDDEADPAGDSAANRQTEDSAAEGLESNTASGSDTKQDGVKR